MRNLEMLTTAEKILFAYAKVKEEEEILLVTDPAFDPGVIESLQNVAYSRGLLLKTLVLTPQQLQVPSENTVKFMELSRVIIVCTSKKFMASPAAALSHGRRLLSLTRVTGEQMVKVFSVDQNRMRQEMDWFARLLSGAGKMEIRTAIGTELTLELGKRKLITVDGEVSPGETDTFPGVIGTTPLETKSNGRIVVDATVGWLSPAGELINFIVRDPVTLQMKEGKVTGVDGNLDAVQIREFLAQGGVGTDIAGEIGLGLNSALTKPAGTVLLDEALYGAVHLGIGHNIHLGGENKASQHIDVTAREATIVLDGRVVVERGVIKR